MNKANLKSYAPKARLDFIAAVTARANILGISANGASPADVRGDMVIIDGREWPAKVSAQRDELIARIKRRGFDQTMEEVAYTWFNRVAALRFMEIHEYLDHGWRVLSSRDGGMPEIIRHASEVSLPGLNAARAREMQLAGDQDNELYKLLLVAQCNELSRSMPFLFEHIDDKTELLLPENLLRTDSIVAKLVAAVPEEDWQQIEVIGWLYQFYISEKKDQVIGKVVRSEDIPAATQLFTPNWIVQYLVQNSVGRLWLMGNPGSSLATHWPYYIQPAEQTSAVQAQVDALIQSRTREGGEALNPETITVLDPACGSGHILVVAYDVLKAIYLERGYQPRAIPRLILEKNLYGLDIDDRAAQLAAFALLMRARADDPRLLNHPPKINVLSLKESNGLDVDELATQLAPFGVRSAPLKILLHTFEDGKTFGSLIQIPTALNEQLAPIMAGVQQALREGDLYGRQAAQEVLPLVSQARTLGMRFDAVVANPPYMGAKFFGGLLKTFIEENYKSSKGDLYTCFMVRNTCFASEGGIVGMITIPNWMFLSTYHDLRDWLFNEVAIETFCHNGRGVFGSDFGSCAFTYRHNATPDFKGRYKRLFEKHGSVSSNEELDSRFGSAATYEASAADFRKIPGSPVSYWVSTRQRDLFTRAVPLGTVSTAVVGQNTGDNDLFLRKWYEIDVQRINFSARNREETFTNRFKWYPYNKGGKFRRWYGNLEFVVNWQNDAEEIKRYAVIRNEGKHWSRYIQNLDFVFREGLTWSDVTSGILSGRYLPAGTISDVSGPSAFFDQLDLRVGLSIINSAFTQGIARVLNPTIHFQAGNYRTIPYISRHSCSKVSSIVSEAIAISKHDWDGFETSWDFAGIEFTRAPMKRPSLAESWENWKEFTIQQVARLKVLEEDNNNFFNEAYDLVGEVSPDVPEDQISHARASREEDCQRLISYGIGCVMGRYSLDEPGLIYAQAGNVGFDFGRYATFGADSDGIVPLTDEHWFGDDGASRVREFIHALWGPRTLEANLAWLAEGIGTKSTESPDDTVRRYLADKFFKSHLQTYKKRPIYWLFSSGKLGAFQALVYLHRYHEGTLARLRAEYIVPLIARVITRLEMLERDAGAASSAAARTKVQKQIELLRKKQIELMAYDEKLRHYADMRIVLDLDDGVKINYGKFGELLAESKAVTGGSDD